MRCEDINLSRQRQTSKSFRFPNRPIDLYEDLLIGLQNRRVEVGQIAQVLLQRPPEPFEILRRRSAHFHPDLQQRFSARRSRRQQDRSRRLLVFVVEIRQAHLWHMPVMLSQHLSLFGFVLEGLAGGRARIRNLIFGGAEMGVA